MPPHKGLATVRRSVVLPADLVRDALRFAPAPLRENLNQLTVTALREYTDRRRAIAFAEAMAAMAADPAVRSVCAVLARGLAAAEGDGLGERE
jgi:hypothetical protein